MQTIEWDPVRSCAVLIDQRKLPGIVEFLCCYHYPEIVKAISNMTVRGAPAIGVAAAFGMALAVQDVERGGQEAVLAALEEAGRALVQARPTAVNLVWAVNRMLKAAADQMGNLAELRQYILNEALAMAREDVETNRRMAEIGAQLIEDGDTILHHCNTGSLATVDWGTALGVIRMAHAQGKRIHVLVDETRPRLQGSRLTAWELDQYGIPYDIICDGAAGYYLRAGRVQKVFHGADRVAANGDLANKVGTYMLDLAAKTSGVPVYPVFPCSTVDLTIHSGDEIEIEERDPAEVLGLQFEGERVAPENATALNPAFDITPHELITAWVTDLGIVHAPFEENFLSIQQKDH